MTRKTLLELDEPEMVIFRALVVELETLTDSIQVEALARCPDLVALAVANRDRRYVIQWLRNLNLPSMADYCDGPDLVDEELLLKEAVAEF